MLVISGENFATFKAIKDVLKSRNAYAKITESEILFESDEPSEDTIDGFYDQMYSEIRNFEESNKENVVPKEKDELKEKKTHPELKYYNGGVSYLEPKKEKKKARTNAIRPKSWEFWRADFGLPIGKGEMGYIHYVLVYCEGDQPDSYVVFPCTSKYRDYESVYRIKFTEENMEVYDEEFLEKSKETFILYNMQEPIDISRFEKCVGTVDEKYIAEILTSLKVAQEAMHKKAVKNLSESQINNGKRNLSKANLSFSSKQLRMMDCVCDADVFSIANNMSYTYEKRVTSLVNLFGLPVVGDGEFLIDFIKRAKNDSLKLDTILHAMARRKTKSYKLIKERLARLMNKTFKMDEAGLIEFAKLINMLAG